MKHPLIDALDLRPPLVEYPWIEWNWPQVPMCSREKVGVKITVEDGPDYIDITQEPVWR